MIDNSVTIGLSFLSVMKSAFISLKTIPNGHTTLNRGRCDVDFTLICRRPNLSKFSRHFHVVFRCNFAD